MNHKQSIRRHETVLRHLAIGAAVGALVSHLLDPDRGHARRARLHDELAAGVRHVGRNTHRAMLGRVRRARDHVAGLARHELHSMVRERPDDATLAQKVRSEVLGTRHVRGISVDAASGVVHLRGQLPTQELIDQLTVETARVFGVDRVESYLHLPGTPASNKRAALASASSATSR